MWAWRTMERISWKEKITNMNVLMRVEESKTIVDTIVRRKLDGHVLGKRGPDGQGLCCLGK